eukprot:4128156-Prymnesium_polylepis.1
MHGMLHMRLCQSGEPQPDVTPVADAILRVCGKADACGRTARRSLSGGGRAIEVDDDGMFDGADRVRTVYGADRVLADVGGGTNRECMNRVHGPCCMRTGCASLADLISGCRGPVSVGA